MILYNGQTGGLGRYFDAAARDAKLAVRPLHSRLEDRRGLSDELLYAIEPQLRSEEAVTLVLMAAQVSVPLCENDPVAAYQTNVVDTLATARDVVEWAKKKRRDVKIVYVSTGHVYAASPLPVKESTPVCPMSMYAGSKLSAEHALQLLARRTGALCVVARLFGLVSPQQPAYYILPGLIRRALQRDVSPIPGLDYIRDYLDARDACRVLVALCRQAPDGVFNVCSGVPVRVRVLFNIVCEMLGGVPLNRVIAAEGRPGDMEYLVGDNSKLVALGIRPKTISLKQTVYDALEQQKKP